MKAWPSNFELNAFMSVIKRKKKSIFESNASELPYSTEWTVWNKEEQGKTGANINWTIVFLYILNLDLQICSFWIMNCWVIAPNSIYWWIILYYPQSKHNWTTILSILLARIGRKIGTTWANWPILIGLKRGTTEHSTNGLVLNLVEFMANCDQIGTKSKRVWGFVCLLVV